MVDIEVVIQELENAANEAVADVQNEVNEKQRLEEENKRLAVCIIIDWRLKYRKIYTFYGFENENITVISILYYIGRKNDADEKIGNRARRFTTI